MAAEDSSNTGSTESHSAAQLARDGAGLLRRLIVPKGLALLIGGEGSGGLLLTIPRGRSTISPPPEGSHTPAAIAFTCGSATPKPPNSWHG